MLGFYRITIFFDFISFCSLFFLILFKTFLGFFWYSTFSTPWLKFSAILKAFLFLELSPFGALCQSMSKVILGLFLVNAVQWWYDQRKRSKYQRRTASFTRSLVKVLEGTRIVSQLGSKTSSNLLNSPLLQILF